MKINIWVLVAIIVLSIIPAGVQAQSDDGLVAEWHFDEGSGSVLVDSSGNGNDGVIYGATWVEGKYGYGLLFNGVDNYVEVPHSTSLDITNAITIEAWVKMNSMKDMAIVGKEYNQYGFVYGMGWLTPGGKPPRKFIGRTATGGSTNEVGYIWSPAFEQFYHLTFTYDNSFMKLYIDGVKVASLKQSGSFNSNDKSLIIGMRSGNNDLYFNGIIDEVSIYKRALSAEEIKTRYEQGPDALALTKTATPQSIKQGQTTTITLTVKNTGTTEIKDIEIADTIPSYLTFIDGETSKRYDSLAPKDTRQFYYTLQLNDAGTFNLEPAIATYADDRGNYNTVKSKPASIEVIRSIIENSAPTPKPMNGNAQTASVHLHGEKTDVVMGEDILLKLAAVNLITKPTMHVQVIITPPSGMSVTSSEFVQSGAGLFTASYEIEPGVGRDIEVRMRSNQVGDFVVNGRIVYYFGGDMDDAEDHTLTLPITVRAGAEAGVGAGVERTTGTSGSEGSSTPGFAAVVAVIGLLAVYLRRKRI